MISRECRSARPRKNGRGGGRVIRESALWNVAAFWRMYLGVQIDHQAIQEEAVV